MTVEELIQQQSKKTQQVKQIRRSEMIPELAAEEELLDKIRSSREESSQDPIYTLFHRQGKVKLGKIMIESF